MYHPLIKIIRPFASLWRQLRKLCCLFVEAGLIRHTSAAWPRLGPGWPRTSVLLGLSSAGTADVLSPLTQKQVLP